ncbi:trichothecene 3-O-acetyltransferas-like protein [Massariosphaeria phaeospora]|uniref:Trichothecene 3-O-acetyltransferas-like protein n=1 Tax=Massariosphaeria phaeospora TaxID=100035 RepID=A0A7C8M905_9PLEO|nr:trichothecene 3-O-acetyltransferas-like protein [Massariosphaeria phaeospora]
MATKTFHLSFQDQNTVRVYTSVLLIFPFPDSTKTDSAIDALSGGLQATLTDHPWLAGTLSLAVGESGKLCLKYPVEMSDMQMSGIFASKRIPRSEGFPYTYATLKEQGMPPSVFKGELFRPNDFDSFAGIAPNGEGLVDFEKSNAPAMRVQAYFIPGGLVLGTYIHHSLADCSGVTQFWKHYAHNISRQVGVGTPYQSKLRVGLDACVPTLTPGQLLLSEAYCDGKYEYPRTLEENSLCSQKLFVISAARIRAFREELKPLFPDHSPPTICNILAALLWVHVTRARATRLGDCAHKKTNLGIAIDLRKRLDPRLGDEYMGNLAVFAKGTLKIADVTAEERVTVKTILAAVKRIKDTISRVDNDWAKRQLGFFKSIDPIRDTECALGFRFGLDMYITSWMNFGADIEWNIPGTTLAIPEFIRRTYNPSDGGMMIWPRKRILVDGVEAPYEVMVRLAFKDMQTLLHEEGGLSHWAERIID